MVTKLSAKQATTRESVIEAIAGINNGTYSSPYTASKATGAPVRTIYRRLNGVRSVQDTQALRQLLSVEEENALANWAKALSSTGHPVSHSFLRELAEEIRKPRLDAGNPNVPSLGLDWTKRFMRRHPQLKTTVATGIEVARKEVTKESLNKWFEEFQRVIEEHDIDPSNVYNMDETGAFTYSLLQC